MIGNKLKEDIEDKNKRGNLDCET